MNRLWWRDTKGFTLLECLAALLMLSGILLTADGIIRHVRVMAPRLEQRGQREWETCLLQMENELATFQYTGVRDGKVHFFRQNETDTDRAVLEKYKNMMRLSINGGHAPLMTEIKRVRFEESQHGILITVELLDGTTQKGWWLYS